MPHSLYVTSLLVWYVIHCRAVLTRPQLPADSESVKPSFQGILQVTDRVHTPGVQPRLLDGVPGIVLDPRETCVQRAVERVVQALKNISGTQRTVVLTTPDLRLSRAMIRARPSLDAKLAIFNLHSYHPKGYMCDREARCLEREELAAFDRILVYNQQARALSRELAPKMSWLPVTWAGSGGLAQPLTRAALSQRWAASSVGGCGHFATLGHAHRSYAGLLQAVAEQPLGHQRPKLRMIGHNLPEVHERCRELGPRRCEVIALENATISQAEYLDALSGACFVAIPVADAKLGVGLTAASEAASLGKAVVVPPLPWWEGYVTHGESGLVLRGNSAADWRAVLDSFASDPQRWRRLERGAQELAMKHFSIEAVRENLAEIHTQQPATGSALLSLSSPRQKWQNPVVPVIRGDDGAVRPFKAEEIRSSDAARVTILECAGEQCTNNGSRHAWETFDVSLDTPLGPALTRHAARHHDVTVFPAAGSAEFLWEDTLQTLSPNDTCRSLGAHETLNILMLRPGSMLSRAPGATSMPRTVQLIIRHVGQSGEVLATVTMPVERSAQLMDILQEQMETAVSVFGMSSPSAIWRDRDYVLNRGDTASSLGVARSLHLTVREPGWKC
mmetsp:Transcript_93873/g.265592  ORF Transcript_93873/g.265592 Transcript_93873/m.265592 type:complete len:618 (-) Transcript_93873:13-1866(-)|eukprot:CAMPEP_0168421130 /NCGR_PEP_ID=MMETSP0228-20121227/33124_1 /TAXON_ID=133427 /ORGANISM="Protoceratium reticulatum, Strain CCCM 535 (=CCMP 1889)" /LENGTH=617 /DNA_ID=CAMNT_0008435031 /DNA_START=58 /DNA_END=1911 /DNA_ORIENTATION=+